MAAVVLVELAVAVLAWFVFLALSRGMWNSTVGRQMVLSAAVATGEAASLLALGLGLPVPLWVFVVGFGAADVVVLRWVVLRVRARRERVA